MPRNNEQQSVQQWIKFDEKNPQHISLIEAFGKLIDSKFKGSWEEYEMNRERIGKLSFRKLDGSYRGVKELGEGSEVRYVRMPYAYLEEKSKFEAWQRIKLSRPVTPTPDANLPF